MANASVSGLLADAKSYAANTVADARSAMGAATSAASAIPWTIFGYTEAKLPDYEQPEEIGPVPVMSEVTLDVGTAPTPATLGTIPTLSLGSAPVFTATQQPITDPNKPSQVAAFADTPPAITTSFDFPEPPDALINPLIDEPVIPVRQEPVKPQVSLPAFDAMLDDPTFTAPTNLETQFANAYASAAPSTITMINGYVDAMLAKYNPQYASQMAAIEAQLTKYLQGGTGLNASVENAIYERAKSKNDAEARRVRDAALADAAARGFTIPGGALLSAIQQARQAGADNNATSAREIVVMQAEMEQKNLQFAVTTSANLRTTLLNATMSYMQNLTTINGQALDYAKTVLSAVIEVFNSQVKMYGMKVEVYKAEAQVFEVKLKAAMAGIELYKAEIDALQALVQMDHAKVEVYKARIETLSVLANVYRSQIEAITSRAGLEKLKLDLFQSQVQAYSALVQAKNAEWQGYSAQIEGQLAKVKVFSAQADAFNAQVNGYKVGIDAQSAAIQAAAINNESIAKNNASLMDTYKVTVMTKGEIARTKLAANQTKLQAYEASVKAIVAKASSAAEYYKAHATVNIENAKLGMQSILESSKSSVSRGETLTRVATANAQIFGQLASSAMSGMNTIAGEMAIS